MRYWILNKNSNKKAGKSVSRNMKKGEKKEQHQAINKEKKFVSAVVYVRNVEHQIEVFINNLLDVLNRNFETSEIICVNDSSDDASAEVVRAIDLSRYTSNVSLVHLNYFHGREAAMNAGVDIAIGDFVFEFDYVDYQFDESMIMDAYNEALGGYDIVSAVPINGGKLSSRMFYKILNLFSERQCQYMTESFCVLSRRAINRVYSSLNAVPYRKIVYQNCGLRTLQKKYEIDVSKTMIDKKERQYRGTLAVDSLILFTDVGYRFSKCMSVSMMLITLAVLIYTLIAYYTSNPVEGWTSTVLFLSVAFFGLFIVLTIIIKYLQIIVRFVYKRNSYHFGNIEKLSK